MAERPEDLNLPITVVQRIIKESLPDGVIVSKEARQAISRASSVFVLYLTACAVTHANKAKRKTLAVNDIISAISDMEFDPFIEPLNEALKLKKEQTMSNAKKPPNSKNASTAGNNQKDENDEDEDEIEEDEEPIVDDENMIENENEISKGDANKSTNSEPNNKKRKITNNKPEENNDQKENLEPDEAQDDDEDDSSDSSQNEHIDY